MDNSRINACILQCSDWSDLVILEKIPIMTLKPGTYKHTKSGKMYKVLGVAKHSETLEECVVYEALYENTESSLWIRPLEMFTDEIELDGKKVPRFTFVE